MLAVKVSSPAGMQPSLHRSRQLTAQLTATSSDNNEKGKAHGNSRIRDDSTQMSESPWYLKPKVAVDKALIEADQQAPP